MCFLKKLCKSESSEYLEHKNWNTKTMFSLTVQRTFYSRSDGLDAPQYRSIANANMNIMNQMSGQVAPCCYFTVYIAY